MCSAFAPALPAAGGCGVLIPGCGILVPGVLRPCWGVASLARRQGCGSAAPFGGDFLLYISDFLRYISTYIFWIIADN